MPMVLVVVLALCCGLQAIDSPPCEEGGFGQGDVSYLNAVFYWDIDGQIGTMIF